MAYDDYYLGDEDDLMSDGYYHQDPDLEDEEEFVDRRRRRKSSNDLLEEDDGEDDLDGLANLEDDDDIEDESYENELEDLVLGDKEKKSKPKKFVPTFTEQEKKMMEKYDDIYKAGAKPENAKNAVRDSLTILLRVSPQHSSLTTVEYIVNTFLQKQGKNRIVMVEDFGPTTSMSGEEFELDVMGRGDSASFNREFTKAAQDYVASFVAYLAGRDLSDESVVSKRKKQRHLPAFIIYMFSSNLYNLIVGCPTMPEVYNKQINDALETISKQQKEVLEDLAKAYEQAGREEVAKRVREEGLSWFNKEPAEIRAIRGYDYLNFTQEDVQIYRNLRGRYTNLSKSITQEVMSELIEVETEPGVFDALKDKTRTDAIAEVKVILKEWSKKNPNESDLANKIIWKDVEGLTKL